MQPPVGSGSTSAAGSSCWGPVARQWRVPSYPAATPFRIGKKSRAVEKKSRAVAARRAGGIRIAVRELAGEGAEHGDAQGVNVGRFVSGFAGKHFGSHISGD